MKATSYVSSANALSLVLLSILFVTVDVTHSEINKLDQLTRVRSSFAEWHMLSSLGRTGVAELQTRKKLLALPLPIHAPDRYWMGSVTLSITELEDRTATERLPLEDGSWLLSYQLNVTPHVGNKWAINSKYHYSSKNLLNLAVPLNNESLKALARVESSLSIEPGNLQPQEDSDIERRFVRVHNELLKQKIKIPVIDSEVRTHNALFLLAGLMLSLLVVIRGRVFRIFTDEELAVSEPWTLIDEGTLLETAVYFIWMSLVLIGPWIVGGSLLATISWQVQVNGANSALLEDIFLFGSSIAVMLVSAWVSLSLIGAIVQLRVLRAEYRESLLSSDEDKENCV